MLLATLKKQDFEAEEEVILMLEKERDENGISLNDPIRMIPVVGEE
jgi:hypothetical protein